MPKKPESRLQRKIRAAIEAKFGGWWVKTWGGPFTGAGLPDLRGYINGRPFELEVKVPKKGRLSSAQIRTILELREHGVAADVVESIDEALEVVGWFIQALAKVTPESRHFIWSKEDLLRELRRATDRENRRSVRRYR